MQTKRLVLFDFDGTITRKDTFLQFILHVHGLTKFLIGFCLLSPLLLAMKLKLVSNQVAKESVLKFFFGGTPTNTFDDQCRTFAENVIPTMVRPLALAALSKFKMEGYTVVVVSASPENWVKPWCNSNQLVCIATKLEVVDNKVTGYIQGKNCYGKEKTNRIRQALAVEEFDEIIAYGDSRGDREMLAMAHVQNYKPFQSP